jgi:hypothetical protein
MSFSTTLYLVLSVALAMGIFGIAAGIYSLRKSKATESWPKTAGKITSNHIEKRADDKSGDLETQTDITTYMYIPQVTYEYTVDKKYTSSSISIFIHMVNTEEKAQKFLNDNYPVGKEVAVSYNPAKPKDAVLEPGASSGGYFFIALGVVFALVGGIGLAVKFLNH